jgi:hypothetical protein
MTETEFKLVRSYYTTQENRMTETKAYWIYRRAQARLNSAVTDEDAWDSLATLLEAIDGLREARIAARRRPAPVVVAFDFDSKNNGGKA